MSVRTFRDAKGGKRFAVEFEQRGHRVFRRLPPGATKEQAHQLETRLKHELIDQTILGKKPNVSLKFAIESWLAEVVEGRKSETQTRNHAAAVQLGMGDERLSDAPIFGVAIRENQTLSAATRNRRLCVLKAVAKFAWRKGWTEENLSGKIQLLPEPTYRRREVTFEDARKLIRHASTPRAKALIALSAYTGLRLGEVLKLRAEDVRDGVIVARDTKNGTDRIIPILDELKSHLKQLPFQAGWRNVYRGFESARKRAGLDIRYHDLRHMVASAVANSGGSQALAMKLLGHKTSSTHQRYIHPEVEAMRGMLRKALRPSKSHQKRESKKKAARKAA